MKPTAYLLQSVLVSLWWIGLFGSRRFFEAFQFDGIAAIAFWSFLTPDLLLIAGLSVIRAYRESNAIEYVIVGAFGYATLYCWNASWLTRSGWLPTTLMSLGLAYNLFLCFDQFAFRNARETSVATNAIKTSLQIVCVWLIALVIFPSILLEAFGGASWPPLHGRSILAIGMFGLFSLLGLSSSYWMVREGQGTPLPLDQTNHLVVSGPYRYVRNPMAIAGIGQGCSIALLFGSIPILVYSLLGSVIWHVVVRPIEEQDLATRFGEEYVRYRQEVSCWIPRFGRKSFGDSS